MIISDRHKFIFLAIPKTGSTSIQLVLQNHGMMSDFSAPYNHKLSKEIMNEFPIRWKNYYKLCFVRNPWDRHVSLYFWKRKFHKDKYRDFKHFCEIDNDRWYHQYILDDDGNQILDFIGRFEKLQEDFNVICDKFRLGNYVLPHKMQQPEKNHYTTYYDDILIERVYKIYNKFGLIDRLGYEFGD